MKRRQFLTSVGALGIAFLAMAFVGALYPMVLYPYVAYVIGLYHRQGERRRFGPLPSLPGSLTYPEENWERLSPEQAGVDLQAWETYLEQQHPSGSTQFGENHPRNQWGTAIAINGRLLHTWGNPDYLYQSASVGKALTKMALQLAIDRRLIKSENDFVRDYWAGDGSIVNGMPQGTLSECYC